MASLCVMKQLREKHVSAEISKCVWSPKMDLLAIANVQGQIILHRLSWQQVWVLSPPTENMKVSAISWRLDSKVLAVAYVSGRILLVNIEDGSTIHELVLKDEVSALSWSKFSSGKDQTQIQDHQECQEQDAWSSYMYPLPPLSKSFGDTGLSTPTETWQEPRLLQDQTELNVLCVGTARSSLQLYAFGLFHIATVDLSLKEGEMHTTGDRVVSVTPSPGLDFVSVVLETEKGADGFDLMQVNVDTQLVSTHHVELRLLAQKYGQIHALMAYIGRTLVLAEEAWETALLEMDSKLALYADSVPEGGVAADFLDLLVFGHTTADFEIFLTNKLTEKNLKKLRHSVDLCYSTMQRLVVKHLQQVGVTLVFLLSQVEGMSKRKERYGLLGVQATEVEEAMGCVGSFLLKAAEMLQAIESSMRDFHVFLRWVSSVHLRLLREHVPAELNRMSQQETAGLLQFLNESFEEVVVGTDGERRTHFRLERAGQYLKNEELKTLSHAQPTPFAQLVKNNPALAAHRLIFIHNPRTSLLQEHESLADALTKMGQQPGVSISSSINVGERIPLAHVEPNSKYTVAQISHPDGTILNAVVPRVKHQSLLLMELGKSGRRAGSFNVGAEEAGSTTASPFFQGPSTMGILDAQFYTPETLSVLLLDSNEPRFPSFAQLIVQALRTNLVTPIPRGDGPLASSLPHACIFYDAIALRRLEAGSASSLAVSGPRRVAAVIGENRRRVRLYEMEADEDEEEDLDGLDDSSAQISRNESSLLDISGSEINDNT